MLYLKQKTYRKHSCIDSGTNTMKYINTRALRQQETTIKTKIKTVLSYQKCTGNFPIYWDIFGFSRTMP